MGQIALQIPVAGNPNSSEDPKVASNFSTVQTWANGNVDTTNLAAAAGVTGAQLAAGARRLASRALAVNGTAVVNDLIVAQPGITVTLPTSPAADSIVAVVADSNVTGASPVTVSAAQWIRGVGLPSTGGTFTLGTGGSFAVLQFDGAAIWRIVAGQQDTGWKTITLPANWATTAGFNAPAARLVGDLVWLRGDATNNTGGNAFFSASLPAGMSPAKDSELPAVSSAAGPAALHIISSGSLTGTTIANGGSQAFDGCAYSL